MYSGVKTLQLPVHLCGEEFLFPLKHDTRDIQSADYQGSDIMITILHRYIAQPYADRWTIPMLCASTSLNIFQLSVFTNRLIRNRCVMGIGAIVSFPKHTRPGERRSASVLGNNEPGYRV